MYHRGEQEAQERAGERILGERNGRVITNRIIPGAINFIEKQPFFIVSSQNNEGEILTSVLAGDSGFVKVVGESTFRIERNKLNSNPFDAFWTNIQSQPKLGMLFIELSSRRRFRINGIAVLDDEGLTIDIHQAYPNCPKYIQQRHLLKTEKPEYLNEQTTGEFLSPELSELISSADTFFVGSANDEGDLDASHRGGAPGFIQVVDTQTLLIPDYQGNSMYNTLGNFFLNPNAGLLFLDFLNGRSLQLVGTAEVIWKDEQAVAITGGTGRLWKFQIKQWLVMENLKGYDWNFIDYSPFNPVE